MKVAGNITIENGKLIFNGDTLLDAPDSNFDDFIRDAYRISKMNYPKFFKMDSMCKLGVLGTHLLVSHTPNTLGKVENTAVIIATEDGCYATDQTHQESIENYAEFFPRPAVFVYTLPNIVTGEICIKEGFTGESTCFIMEEYDEKLLLDYAESLILNDSLAKVLIGWINYSHSGYTCLLKMLGK